MNSLKAIQLDPYLATLLSSYWQYRKLWVLTTVAFCVLGLTYALLLKKDTWVASQALIVRDEATGAVMRLGRFESQTQMKASQETVLEMARNPQVVEAALKAVGRPPRLFGFLASDAPPSRSEIEQFAKSSVVVRAPRGAELGTTEVIYLDVKESSQERAVQLAGAVCDALEKQLKLVRVELAAGVIQELEAARDVCEASLQEVTEELQKIEIEVGSDLADLRGLSDVSVGSTNRLMLDMVRDELRKADLSIRTMEPNFQLAKSALEDPSLVLQAAEVLKELHPAIEQLLVGLSAARVKTATLEGRFTATHPEVLNARKTEAAFQNSLLEELAIVVKGYQASIAISQQKIDALNGQEAELGRRLNRLADVRGKYTNLVAEVKSRADTLSQIKKELTQTVASRDAALAASLLTRLDKPVLGEKPMGPGRTTIIGGATVGGLMFGLGVVFLLVPLDGRPASSGPRQDVGNRTGRSTDNNRFNQAQSEALQGSIEHCINNYNPAPPTPSSPATVVSKNQSLVPNAPVQFARTTTAVANAAQTASTPAQVGSAQDAAKLPTTIPSSKENAVASFESSMPHRPESIDDVRDLIANALKSHTQSGNT